MDEHHLDTLIRYIFGGASRRTMVRRLIAAGTGLASIHHVQTGAKTRKRRLRRNAAPRLNAYGCLDVGRPCRGNDTLCCSGICQGMAPRSQRRDRSRCAAHHTGGCQLAQDICIGPGPAPCGTDGSCVRTTGNAPFCFTGPGDCTGCARDPDCEPQFGPGAACIVCEGDCGDGSNLVCVRPAAV